MMIFFVNKYVFKFYIIFNFIFIFFQFYFYLIFILFKPKLLRSEEERRPQPIIPWLSEIFISNLKWTTEM